MYYHASPFGGISVLEPRVSNHNIPLVYFSTKRENTLVYLSNSIERLCKKSGFIQNGPWHKWASYGFNKNGIQRIEEYYPDALKETYSGVSGYIYYTNSIIESGSEIRIPYSATSGVRVHVDGYEYIEDAYEEILKAESEGLIEITRYDDMSDRLRLFLERIIPEEYKDAIAKKQLDYKFFLESKFPHLLSEKKVVDFRI